VDTRSSWLVDKLQYVSRHFVVMTWFQQHVRDHAQDATWRYFAVSGFVMSFGGDWYVATAGHILEQLEENRVRQKTRVRSFALIDHGGVQAKFQDSIPFMYEDAAKHYVVDSNAGLDYGFIAISTYFRKLLKANSVIPLAEEHWRQEARSFRDYAVLGCPTVHQSIDEETDYGPMIGHAQVTVMPVAKLAKEDEPKPKKHPRFFAKVLDTKVADIDGFSGGPLIGFGAKKDGVIPYRVVAMQYAWDEKRRIIRASPLSVFAPLFENYYASKK